MQLTIATKMLFLCIFVTVLAGIEAQGHGSFEIEYKCLEGVNKTMDEVLPYVHKITDPEDKEDIGPFLACVWEARKIISASGRVSGKYVAFYLNDIYSSLNLTIIQKYQIWKESKQCEKLKAKDLPTLGVKVKNCILITVDNLSFLSYPSRVLRFL